MHTNVETRPENVATGSCIRCGALLLRQHLQKVAALHDSVLNHPQHVVAKMLRQVWQDVRCLGCRRTSLTLFNA
jgi:hypothetical protein